MITAAGNVDAAKRAGDDALASAQERLAVTKLRLQKNRKDQPYMEKRLHRNAHPRFLHYLQFNRQAKVERLGRELEALRQEEIALVSQMHALEDEVSHKSRAAAILTANVANVLSAQSERKRLFDFVVASQPATSLQISLTQQIFTLDSQRSIENALASQLRNCHLQINASLSMFQEAMGHLRAASQDNNMAQAVNLFDGRDDFAETAMQWQRDQELNTAKDVALRAQSQLQRALTDFPYDARARYPHVASSIGSSAFMPHLQGANFGNTLMAGFAFGEMGDFFNDLHAAQKIHRNKEKLQEVIDYARAQSERVRAVIAVVDAEIARISTVRDGLSAQLEQERVRQFERARASSSSLSSTYPQYGVPAADAFVASAEAYIPPA